MTDAEIWEKLLLIFREVFFDDHLELAPEMTGQDVMGWDSYKFVEVILGVENAFGLRLHSREIEQLQCVGDIAVLVASKLGASG
jgi:Acyl carrier protein